MDVIIFIFIKTVSFHPCGPVAQWLNSAVTVQMLPFFADFYRTQQVWVRISYPVLCVCITRVSELSGKIIAIIVTLKGFVQYSELE
jgi:hypothetical protein